jgi:alkaline phosphatase
LRSDIDPCCEPDLPRVPAVKFYEKRPEETLVIVTGDHETGGMAIGFAGTQYSSFVDKIQRQKMSYIEFNKKLETYKNTHTLADAKFEDLLPLVKEGFGLYVMTADEKWALEKAVTDGQVNEASELAKKEAKERKEN